MFAKEGKVNTLPFLILSDDLLNQSAAGIVVGLSVSYVKLPIHSHIKANIVESGSEVYICCEQILTVSVNRCTDKLGAISQSTMNEVGKTVKLLLAL